jgi:hypothetical protein
MKHESLDISLAHILEACTDRLFRSRIRMTLVPLFLSKKEPNSYNEMKHLS